MSTIFRDLGVPFKTIDGFYAWARGLWAQNQDLSIELRGKKGRGKSAFELWSALRIGGREHVTPDDLMQSLAYSHDQFVRVYRRNDALRAAGKKGPVFLLADDATRLLNKRRHASRKNQAILDLYRTMRASQQAIMYWLTQDDLLEGPIREGGNYVLFEWRRAFVPTLVWPSVKNGKTTMVPLFEVPFPKPEDSYPATWKAFQDKRSELTKELTAELLQEIEGGNSNGSPGKTKTDMVLEVMAKHPEYTSTDIIRHLAAKGVKVSSSHIRTVRSDAAAGAYS